MTSTTDVTRSAAALKVSATPAFFYSGSSVIDTVVVDLTKTPADRASFMKLLNEAAARSPDVSLAIGKNESIFPRPFDDTRLQMANGEIMTFEEIADALKANAKEKASTLRLDYPVAGGRGGSLTYFQRLAREKNINIAALYVPYQSNNPAELPSIFRVELRKFEQGTPEYNKLLESFMYIVRPVPGASEPPVTRLVKKEDADKAINESFDAFENRPHNY